MKLGKDSIDELFNAVEKEFTNAELQRLLLRFSITGWEGEGTSPKMIVKSLPYIHNQLNDSTGIENLTQYVLDTINFKHNTTYNPRIELIDIYPSLFNTLLRDGYKVEDFKISRTIPVELENSNIPDELKSNLSFFELTTALWHLEQAQLNYKDGNWAAANAMIRSCFESVLIYINARLNPQKPALTGGNAIDNLTNSGFFRKDLNEADKHQQAYGFIGGLWKMLHPDGSHPGLSQEEDSTFRYHVTLVALNYYLKRLKKETPSP